MAFAGTDDLARSLVLDPTASSGEAKLLLLRLCSEIDRRADRISVESHSFFLAAAEKLERIRGSANSRARLPALARCGDFFHACGYMAEALKISRAIEDLARQVDDKRSLRKGYLLAGMVQGEIGDAGGALINYEKSLQLAHHESQAAEASALINIGTALNYCSLHREAIPCFHRACVIAKTVLDEPFSDSMYRIALSNLAQCYLFLGDFRAGIDAIHASVHGLKDPTDFRGAVARTVREWTYVQLALEIGDIHEGKNHADACWKFGHLGNNPRGLLLARTAMGLCQVFSGDVIVGLELLDLALQSSTDETQKEDALRLKLRALEEAKHESAALACLGELRALLRNRRERGLAAVLSRTEQQYRFPNDVCVSDDLALFDLRESRLQTKLSQRHAADSQIEVLERFAVTADLREDASGEHGYRVGKLSSLLADIVNVGGEKCETLEFAARLHDIGKIGIPDRILTSPDALGDTERDFMNAHTNIGAQLLAKSQLSQLRLAEQIALCHHEWWNGEGYPSGLKGRRIPLAARIVAIADVFDALTHGRPYSAAWDAKRALAEIRARSGTQFDPELVGPFTDLIETLRAQHDDLDVPLRAGALSSSFLQARRNIRALITERETA